MTAETTGAPPPGEEDPRRAPLLQYWFVLVRRRWTVITVAALALAGSTLYTLRQTKLYRASATMILEETPPRVVDKVTEVTEPPLDSTKFYNTQLRLIQSSAVAMRAATNLGLDRDPGFNGEATGREAVENAGAKIRGCLSAKTEKRSRVVTVSCVDTSPERAARIANGVVQAYIDETLATRSLTTVDAVRFLGDQADELRQSLEEAERKLFAFKKENDLLATSFEESHRILSNNLFRLNEELSRVKAAGISLKAQADEAHRARKSGDPSVAAALLGEGQLLPELKHRRAELHKELQALKARYKEGHPKVIETKAALTALDRNLSREIDRVYSGLDLKLRSNRAQQLALERAIADEMKRSLKLRGNEVAYNRLKREVEHDKEVYALVARRLKETELTRPLRQSNVRKLEAAYAPGMPFSPNLRDNLLMALLVGLCAGLGLAFLLEFLDDSVRTPEDMEQVAGLPLLGILPSIEPTRGQATEAIERARAEHVVHHPTSPSAEACQTIATNIMSLFLKKPPRALMVASANPQQGKTLVALNLAMSVAGRGRRVVIVDTDLRRGRLHRAVGVPRAEGLFEVLAQDRPHDECLRETANPRVKILTTGSLPEKVNPLQLLELPDFAELAEKLKEEYDLVIFDSPPVSMVADAMHVGGVCDGAVLVARFRQASRRALRQAAIQLETAQIRVVGGIINDLDPRLRQYGYYKTYSYSQRYGYSYGSDGSGSKK